jgi:hypothetical protein
MNITVEIPDSAAGDFAIAGKDPSRALLEAFALEGYRAGRLSEAGVRTLLGFETRYEVDGFLKEHSVFLPYTREDVERDTAVALEVALRQPGVGRFLARTAPGSAARPRPRSNRPAEGV